MRFKLCSLSFIAISALFLCLVLGCTPQTQAEIRSSEPVVLDGSPANIPITHEDRFETLGASGCYGCHGASETANPLLTGAVPLPEDHYKGSELSSFELDPTHGQCVTCHAQDQ